jgi:hypothetical protein
MHLDRYFRSRLRSYQCGIGVSPAEQLNFSLLNQLDPWRRPSDIPDGHSAHKWRRIRLPQQNNTKMRKVLQNLGEECFSAPT